MENTKLENWTKRMNEYVKKTSGHLFKHNNYKEMFKVIHFKHEDKNMLLTITFDKSYVRFRIKEIKAQDSNSLDVLKDELFPRWSYMSRENGKYFKKSYSYKSIPNFKKMRNVTQVIEKYLEKYYDGTADKTLEIKKFIENLIKSEKFFEKNLTN